MSDLVFSSSRSKILVPPRVMDQSDYNSQYLPVDCDFTDELEYLSVKKIKVQIQFYRNENEIGEIVGQVIDIYTSNKEEFIKVSDGTLIRLDRILQLEICKTEISDEDCSVNGLCAIKSLKI